MVVRIGTSGWSCDNWPDALYPGKLPVARRFSVYTQAFDTVATNSRFYHWTRESTFAGWRTRS